MFICSETVWTIITLVIIHQDQEHPNNLNRIRMCSFYLLFLHYLGQQLVVTWYCCVGKSVTSQHNSTCMLQRHHTRLQPNVSIFIYLKGFMHWSWPVLCQGNLQFNLIVTWLGCTTKKNVFLPLTIRHVYGHCTRDELVATCKWPRKYTWWIRVTLFAQLTACILIRAANWPRVY
jgi:hypothetical protein